MKLVVTYKKEIKEFVKKEIKIFGKLIQEINEEMSIIEADKEKLIINSTMIEKIGILITYSTEFNSIKEYNFTNILSSSETFKVKSKNRKLCIDIGQIIKDNSKAMVDLENPNKIIISQEINGKYLTYMIVSGEEKLTHRGYSISNNEFITPDVARAIIEFGEIKEKGVVFDPFCHQGYIIIEFILLRMGIGPGIFKSKTFDFEVQLPKVKKLTNEVKCFANNYDDLKISKQNAKLAKIAKSIRFGIHNLEDLDFKIKEQTIDYIISALPKKCDIEKLFFQLDYIVAKKGKIILFTNLVLKGYEEYGFKIVKKVKIGFKTIYLIVRE